MLTDLTPEQVAELWRRRQERALRWGRAASLRGYPAVGLDEETEATLAAEPPSDDAGKRRKGEEG